MPRDVYEGIVAIRDDDGLLIPLSGIRVSVFARDTTTLATIYQNSIGVTQGPTAASGGTNGPNPFTTGISGAIEFWAEGPDTYDVLIEDLQAPPRIVPRTFGWNAWPSDEGIVDTAQLADAAVTAEIIRGGELIPSHLSSGLADQLSITNLDGAIRAGFHQVVADQSTSSSSYVDLTTPGPQVTVDVPADGLVCVFGALELKSASASFLAHVRLFEDGNSMHSASATDTLMSGGPIAFETRYTTPFWSGSSSPAVRARAGIICFPATAGEHTYSLRYRSESGVMNFRNRKLWAWTKKFDTVLG
jgi:hypothetical protein